MVEFKAICVQILKNSTVSAIPLPKAIIEFDNSTTVLAAFQKLLSSKVLSAPVRHQHEYVGFIDVRDLVSFVVAVYDQHQLSNDMKLSDLVHLGCGAISLTALSTKHKFIPVSPSDSLFSVAKALVGSLHRVPVVENGKVVNIISQSSIISFLSSKLGPMVNATDASVGSLLSVGTSPVLSVNHHETVINTFKTMDQHKRTGIAIVDSTGRLVGTTTGKDISLFIKSPSLEVLHRPINTHLQIVRSELTDIRAPCIALFSRDPLSRALGLLAATGVHRVYVVNSEEEYSPTKIISISDILRYLTD